MNRFQTVLRHTNSGHRPFKPGKAYWLAVPIIAVALILVVTAQGRSAFYHNDDMTSPSQTVLACLPNATHVETLNLRAKGLKPDTAFAVFVTGFKDARSGATDYVGELATNEEGRGSVRVNAAIDVRKSLNHVVLRLSNAESDDSCFAPVDGPISPLDGVAKAGTAGRTASLATIFTSESRSINDNASLFHTINWRITKCVSTF